MGANWAYIIKVYQNSPVHWEIFGAYQKCQHLFINIGYYRQNDLIFLYITTKQHDFMLFYVNLYVKCSTIQQLAVIYCTIYV
jgi:hypothetical protein